MKNRKGFTLIELLVVIAIIGILAAMVLVALNSARNKAKDARVKGSISQLRAEAEVFYDTGSVYTDFCAQGAATNYGKLSADISLNGGSLTCNSTASTYAVSSTLPSGAPSFCADSTGQTYSNKTAVGGVCT